MDYLFVEFVCFIIIGLFSLVFHEFGHVMGARLNHARNIYLTIGAGKALFVFTIGRLEISVNQFFFMHYITSSNRNIAYKPKEMILISFMGPIFSVFLAVVFYVLFYAIFPVYLLYIGFLFNMWLGIVNLLPFKIGQMTTDGYIIYKILTGSK